MHIPSPAGLLDAVQALPAARALFEHLDDHSAVYLVGGAVRDLLLGGRPADLDLVVEDDVAALAERIGGKVRVYDRFGTSTVELDGHAYDIARARRETYSRPGALPDVEPAPLAEDLKRRDFTVNAIAITLGTGELIAAPHALDDLEARRLRVLHERSFEDDPTRLLRLTRYAARLGFEIAADTRSLVQAAVRRGVMQTVSGSRLGSELRLLAGEADPVAALQVMRKLGLDSQLHQRFGLADPELLRGALELLPPDGRPAVLALAACATEIPPDELRGLLDRLTFEADHREAIVAVAGGVRDAARELDAARRPSEVARVLAGAPIELAALAGARDWIDRLRHVRLEIDGADLLAAGIPEGPAVGAGLRAALAAKLDGRAVGRDAELAEALRAAR